jgi:putative membrane protein
VTVRLVGIGLAAFVVAALAAACGSEHRVAPVAAHPPEGPASTAGLSAQDKTWLAAAHQAGLAEIEAGDLASRKGGTAKIRSLGSMLVTDHTKLDRQLIRTADRLGAPLPHGPTFAQIDQQHRLTSASVGTFDQAFVLAMIPAHQTAIAETETEASHGSNPQVVMLAKQVAPVLRHHLQAFRQASP